MKHLLVSFAAIATTCLAAPTALACSCMGYETADDQIDAHEVVFIGHVVDAGPARDTRSIWQRMRHWAADYDVTLDEITTFQVDQSIKGDLDGDISIRHKPGNLGSACGVSFPRNRELVVLGFRNASGELTTSLCSWPQFTVDAYKSAVRPD